MPSFRPTTAPNWCGSRHDVQSPRRSDGDSASFPATPSQMTNHKESLSMTLELSHVDHPVIAVRDMTEAHERYARLGFTIPPRGSHLEWGTGNWCIMFPVDYLELRGITDASRYTHNLDVFLRDRGEGLMGVAFAPAASSELSYNRAKELGLNPTGLKSLTRRFELPEGDKFPKFNIAYLNEAEIPELLTTVVFQHLTPEIIRSPEWLSHPNTVTGVRSITGVSSDLGKLHDRMKLLVDEKALTLGANGLRINLPKGSFMEYVTPAEAERRGFAQAGKVVPSMPAMTLNVSDINRTREVLREN